MGSYESRQAMCPGGVAVCLARAAWGRKPLSDVYFCFLKLALGLFSVAGWLKVGQRGLMSRGTSN